MSKYDLLVNATATAVKTPPVPQFQSVTPWGATNPNVPAPQQTFELVVTGVGAVSASAQVLVSNDTVPDPSQYNWVAEFRGLPDRHQRHERRRHAAH